MERLTIDQAIAHAQEVAETRTDLCDECRQEHEQLAKWLTKLKAYNDAEQDGQLVVLPCKVGDTVYVMFGEGYRPFVVDSILILANREVQIHMGYPCAGTLSLCVSEFGKTIFFTCEEAEAALKGGAE